LDGVDFSINPQQILGLVGESGSGKTTLTKVLLLLESPTSGELIFEGKDIFTLKERDMESYRRAVQAVFQDPYSSLSPRLRVRDIIVEPLEVDGRFSKRELESKAIEALQMVGLLPNLIKLFPHELSGGQRQRIAIARAISTEARLIILDEPTSSLDVSIRLQVVDLLIELQEKLGHSYFLIGHDIAMIAYMATEMAVMYLGRIVEFAETKEFLGHMHHPYTQALIAAALPDHPRYRRERIMLSGEIANPFQIPSGCRFHPRCFKRKSICSDQEPPLKAILDNHLVACHLY
jgi:peptide/nickel transport system ATP-binding protein